MPRVVHFEVPLKDPEKTAQFYQTIFGWKIEKWPGPVEYWLISTGEEGQPGINGGFMRRDAQYTQTVNTIDVPSLEDAIKQIEANGGKVVSPTMNIPGTKYMAYAQDPEGNVFGLMQFDSSVK